MTYREEEDSMGKVLVPEGAYYGAQTQRAVENFSVSGLRFPSPFIRALGMIKKHACRVNLELGLLDPERAENIIHAAQEVAEGTWDERRDEIGANIIDTLAEYAPNLPGVIEKMQVLGPPDIERIVGITGGNIFHGELLPDQQFGYRPVAGFSQYETPVSGLYLCGSGAWPGGAVFGAP